MNQHVPFPQEPEDDREVVRGIDEDGKLVFRQVGLPELDYSGRWGVKLDSGTENTIAIGEHDFVMSATDISDLVRVGDEVLCSSGSPECFMWGSVISIGTAGDVVGGSPRIRVFTTDISNLRGTFSQWEIQVVGRPQFAITKDVSTTSINPTGAGPFTFTVTAGKFFPPQGKLLMIPLENPAVVLVGLVKAYSGTTLVVDKNSTNATVSESYDSWAVLLLDAPQDALPTRLIAGLKVEVFDSGLVTFAPGSMRDSSNRINLTLSAACQKDLTAVWAASTTGGLAVLSSNLAGTVTSSGTAVTGSGTSFQTTISLGLNPLLGGSTTITSMITTNGNARTVNLTPASATSLTTSSNIGAGATPRTYQRGGIYDNALMLAGAEYVYLFGITMRDSDGEVFPFASSPNPSGVPDLPAGCTYYALFAYASFSTAHAATANVLKYEDFYVQINTVDAGLTAHTNDTSDAHDASAISYSSSSLAATNVDGALDELAARVKPFLNVGTPIVKTIASGAITVTGSYTAVDTEAAAATDNLDTINGGTDGDLLFLISANSARDTTVRDVGVSGGNINLAGDVPFTLATVRDRLVLQYDSASSRWYEISRATN